MAWIKRTLSIPATEPRIALVLSICVAVLGMMSVALVWQAQIIDSQRNAIRWLTGMKFGG
jgi:hypothetical protein